MASNSTLETAGGEGNVHVEVPAWVVRLHDAASVAQPDTGSKEMPPLREISNSTKPVGATGLSDPGEVIVYPALAVIVWPVTDGLTVAEIPVEVAARFTVSATGAEVDAEKLVSPE
jgi:hypothetical protein